MDKDILDRGKHKMRWQYSNGEKGDLNAGFNISKQGSKKAMLALIDEVRKFIDGMPPTEEEKQARLAEPMKPIVLDDTFKITDAPRRKYPLKDIESTIIFADTGQKIEIWDCPICYNRHSSHEDAKKCNHKRVEMPQLKVTDVPPIKITEDVLVGGYEDKDGFTHGGDE